MNMVICAPVKERPMRVAFLLIVLGFPVLDLYATVRFAQWTGVPTYAWLGLAAIAGLYLLRSERSAFRASMVATMHGGQPLLRGLLDSGRRVLAGMLFLLPGILSDVMALVLLALRLNLGRNFAPHAATAGNSGGPRKAIDGEFRRLD
jgi:UPF0716 protein FxsA